MLFEEIFAGTQDAAAKGCGAPAKAAILVGVGNRLGDAAAVPLVGA